MKELTAESFFKDRLLEISNDLMKKFHFTKTRIKEIANNKDMTLKEASLISEAMNCSLFDLELFIRGYKHSIGFSSFDVRDIYRIINNNDIDLVKLLIRSKQIVNVNGVIYNALTNQILKNDVKNCLLKFLLKNKMFEEYDVMHKSNGSIFEDLYSLNLLDEYSRNYYLYHGKDFTKIIIPAYYTEQINSFKKEERNNCVNELIDILNKSYCKMIHSSKNIESRIFETNQNIYYDLIVKYDNFNGRIIFSCNELLKIKDLTNETRLKLFNILNKFSKVVEQNLFRGN